MAAATTLSYHCFGPIVPKCDIGAAHAYVPIGVCEDGANIEFQIATRPIKSDGGGGDQSFEVNEFFLGMLVTIRFKLVPFAGVYVNILRAKSQMGGFELGVSGQDGTLPTPGTVYAFDDNSFIDPGSGLGFIKPGYCGLTLPVLAGEGDGPWWFPSCKIVKPGNNQVSTKETKLDFEFRALCIYNEHAVGDITDYDLYTRTAPT